MNVEFTRVVGAPSMASDALSELVHWDRRHFWSFLVSFSDSDFEFFLIWFVWNLYEQEMNEKRGLWMWKTGKRSKQLLNQIQIPTKTSFFLFGVVSARVWQMLTFWFFFFFNNYSSCNNRLPNNYLCLYQMDGFSQVINGLIFKS